VETCGCNFLLESQYCIVFEGGRDSVVGIATRYELDILGVDVSVQVPVWNVINVVPREWMGFEHIGIRWGVGQAAHG
jgi:hypothetical protein